MSKADEITLDVVSIYLNEIYPTTDMIWHFKYENKEGDKKESVINFMIEEIRHRFSDCNAVIILEKGKVIEVL